MGGSSSQVIGHKYSLGMHLAFCHGPIDKLLGISFADKEAWSGEATGGAFTIYQPELFGGDKREGGVSGQVDVLMGENSQMPDTYMQLKIGDAVPAYRGLFSLLFKDFYMGMNPYLKACSIKAQRIMRRGSDGQDQWYMSRAAIGEDMNPVHIIRECLTDLSWGMGHPASDIKDSEFEAAADMLWNEGFGISLLWSQQTPIEDFIKEVLRHVDGALRVDRATGQFGIKLITDDYDIDSLPMLDENNIDEVTDFILPTIAELTNSVTVQYYDGETGKTASLTVQDIALAQQQGAVIATTIQYPGCTNGELAARLAARDLKALSTPIIGCNVTCDRRVASQLNPGDPLKFKWSEFGVEETVMRVINIRMGTATSQKITIEMAQDVFSLSSAIYAAPPPSGWTDPVNQPGVSPERNLIDAPYYECVQRFGDDRARLLTDTDSYLIGMGTKSSDDVLGGTMWTSTGSADYTSSAEIYFSARGTTLTSLSQDPEDRLVTLNGTDNELIEAGTALQIGDELVRIDNVLPDNVYRVSRAVADTTPQEHPSGTSWWYWDTFSAFDETLRTEGESVNVKLTPRTGKGELAIALAPVDTIVMGNRQARPYPPANVKLNGEYFPERAIAPLTYSWAMRNRLAQSHNLIPWSDGTITPETGTTTSLTFSGPGAAPVTVNDIVATSFNTLTLTDLPNPLTVTLTTHLGSETSMQSVSMTTLLAGYGYVYDNSYGGVHSPGVVVAPQPAQVDKEFILEGAYWFMGVDADGALWSWGRIIRKSGGPYIPVIFKTLTNGSTLRYETPGTIVSADYQYFLGVSNVIGTLNMWVEKRLTIDAYKTNSDDWTTINSLTQETWSPGIVIGGVVYQGSKGSNSVTPKIRKSTDDGSTWNISNTNVLGNIYRMKSVNGTIFGFGGGSDVLAPLMASNDGTNWTTIRFDSVIGTRSGNYCEVTDVTLFNSALYVVVKVTEGPQQGVFILSSTTNGASWVQRHFVLASGFRQLVVFGTTLFAYYDDYVVHTTDGLVWTRTFVEASRKVNDVVVAHSRIYCTCIYGTSGRVWETQVSSDGLIFTKCELDLI